VGECRVSEWPVRYIQYFSTFFYLDLVLALPLTAAADFDPSRFMHISNDVLYGGGADGCVLIVEFVERQGVAFDLVEPCLAYNTESMTKAEKSRGVVERSGTHADMNDV
jgi:hypothetical protein